MLRRSPVVDGQRDDVGFGHKGTHVAVVGRREGGLDGEGAAMDVNEEGKLVGGAGSFGEEEASGYTGFGRDSDVLGLDASKGIGGGRNGFGAEEPLDGAVFKDTEEGREVMGYRFSA